MPAPAETLGRALLWLAREALIEALSEEGVAAQAWPGDWPDAVKARLHAPGACFVTLTQQGELRGCIGTIDVWRPLLDDVRANAVAAALDDTRFAPLRQEELPRTRIEVSLLSALEPLSVRHEADALVQLRPGVDGVVLTCGRHQGVFLPQVWEMLSEPAEFIARLKRKAGLPASYWSPALQLQRFTVQKWQEAA